MGNFGNHAASIGIIFLVAVGLIGLTLLNNPLTDGLTESTTASVVTTASDTDVVVPLGSSPSWYSTTSGQKNLPRGMSVDANCPQAPYTTVSVTGARTSLTLTGAAGAAGTDNCVVTYRTDRGNVNTEEEGGFSLLKIVPLILMLVIIIAMMGTGGVSALSRGFNFAGMTTNPGAVIQAVVILIVGVSMIPTMVIFTGDARGSYGVTPEFSGVTAFFALMYIAYSVSLIASLMTSVRGR